MKGQEGRRPRRPSPRLRRGSGTEWRHASERYLDCAATEVDPRTPLGDYGFDSVCMYAVSGNIEEEWELAVDPALQWHHNTLGALTHYLYRQLGAA